MEESLVDKTNEDAAKWRLKVERECQGTNTKVTASGILIDIDPDINRIEIGDHYRSRPVIFRLPERISADELEKYINSPIVYTSKETLTDRMAVVEIMEGDKIHKFEHYSVKG